MFRTGNRTGLGCVLMALLVAAGARGDDYLIYTRFTPPDLPADIVICVGGYVEDLGVPEIWGDELQYVYFVSDTVACKYRVWVTNHGGPDDPTPTHIEIRQHPDHPDPRFVGPVEPRHFEYVSHADLTGYASNGHTQEFHVDSSGIYLGAFHRLLGDRGIMKWGHNWTYMGQIGPSAPTRTESLAYNPAERTWYAGGRDRTVYELADTDGNGDFMDESWRAIFTYPTYAGDHHDGMEYVGGALWISDMMSDVLGKWKYDADADTWLEVGRYTYSESAHVEGMGFGPCDHFWVGSGMGRAFLYELGDVSAIPCVLAEAGRDVDAWPANLPLVFDASGSHATQPGMEITLYEWDFDGDGVYDYSGPDPVVTHAYAAEALDPNGLDADGACICYTARLRVAVDDPNGVCGAGETTDVDIRTICTTSSSWPPVADAGGPYHATAETEVCLDGSNSFHPAARVYSPDHPQFDDIVSWQWDLDGDGEFDDATEASAYTSWSEPNTYVVSLRVTDAAGRSDTRSAIVTVAAVTESGSPPTATAPAPTACNATSSNPEATSRGPAGNGRLSAGRST